MARTARIAGRTLATLMLAATSAAGCERRSPARGAPGGEPQRGGTAVVAIPGDLDFLNPLVSGEKYTQEVNRYLLFVPLVRYAPDLSLAPALAASWTMEADTAVVFHLRHDVRWTDGAPVTATDVVFTLERARDPRTAYPNPEYFDAWRGVQAVDSFTVRCGFAPRAEPLAGLPFLPIVPRHLLDSIPPDRLRQAEFNHHPVGDGPFRVASYQPNDRWVFAANPDFPVALGGRPHLDRVVLRIIPENAAQMTEALTGGVDMIMYPRPGQLDRLRESPELRVVERPSRQFTFIAWNGLRTPFGDARVRRALALAIDRQGMIRALHGGYGTPAVGPIGPFHWAYDSTLSALPYAPDSARALLAAAGFRDRDGDGVLERPDGKAFRFDLTYPAGNDLNRDMAEFAQANLARVGIELHPRPTELRTLLADVTSPKRRFDAVLLGFESDFRLNLRDLFHSKGIAGPFQLASYGNPAVDSILDSAPLLPDRTQARPLWHRLQRILRDEQPWTFLYYSPDLIAVNKRLQGVDMDIRGTFVSVSRWWIPADARRTAAPDTERR